MPTDKEINEAAARAIGLEPKFVDIGSDGYYTVNLRGPGMGSTPWNPLKHASQSQLLQTKLRMDVSWMSDDSYSAIGMAVSGGAAFSRRCEPQREGQEATLRRAIALVAHDCHTMEAHHANGS